MIEQISSRPNNTAGAVYLFCIGLFLFFLGFFFCWLMWGSFSAAKDTRSWTEVPCIVIQSEHRSRIIGTSPEEYQWRVAFKYQFGGNDYVGEEYKPRGQRWRKNLVDVQSMVEQFPVGMQTKCYVNPEIASSPGAVKAVLAHDTMAAGYSIWFPALFSVGGVGVMFGVLRKSKR